MTTDRELDATAERLALRARLDVFVSSREVCRDLVADTLADGVDRDTVVRAAADVAQFCDEAMAIVTDEYRPPLACHSGCSFCCRKPGVLASLPELIRIVTHLRETGTDGVAARARGYVTQVGDRDPHAPTPDEVVCPLLVDGRCSVYALRPLVCRAYNSTSVDACREALRDQRALVPIFAMLRDVSDGATVGQAAALADVGLDRAVFDLGTALHVLLAADGKVLLEAMLTGDVHEGLTPARHATWVDDLWTRVQDTARTLGLRL